MHDREIKPLWTSATFLVYTGGLTVLLGGFAALGYLSVRYGSGATAAWSLLVLGILYAVAHGLRVRGRQIAAGIFAFASVLAWAVFLVLLFDWFGWHGVATKRSSWAVLGAVGFFAATIHYLVGSPTDIVGAVFGGEPPPHVSPWAPGLAFGLLGFFLVSLGLVGRRRMAATLAPPPQSAPE